jgi:hypothetical protein
MPIVRMGCNYADYVTSDRNQSYCLIPPETDLNSDLVILESWDFIIRKVHKGLKSCSIKWDIEFFPYG